MAGLCSKPLSTRLSTRGLVLALRRLPTNSPACRPTLALTRPAVGFVQRQQFGNQRRNLFGFGRSRDWDDDDADGGKPAADGKVSGEHGVDAGEASEATSKGERRGTGRWSRAKKGRPAAEESASAKGNEATQRSNPEPGNGQPTEAQSADSQPSQAAGAIVPVSGNGLRKETGSPFEPRMLAVPLIQRPLIPGQHRVVQVTNKATVEEIVKAMDQSSPLFVAAFLRRSDPTAEVQEDGATNHEDLGGLDPMEALYSTGTRARVVQAGPMAGNKDGKTDDAPTSGFQLLLQGRDLVKMDKVLNPGPPLQVQVSKVQLQSGPKEGPVADEIKAYLNETMQTIREIMKINPQFREHTAILHQGMQRMEHGDPHALAHFAACLTTSPGPELMEVLEAEDLSEKLKIVLTLVKKELEIAKVQQKISTQISEKVSKTQRDFMLREQLKMIKKELGEDKSDGSDLLAQKFKKRLEGKTVPQEAQEAIDSEMEKLSGLAKESQEFQITRNYLDWLTVLPWGVHSEDTLSLRKARAILDKDHHGLADVKQRILELIAVGTLRGTVQGKIVCFVGPPGVGKTSIGKSIAQALGREFYRFSVGGLYDVAEIKGHRRTYVGAMPGKAVQCLKKTQSANPLVLIDEIDKIGRGHQGDPASALLELLDPSQNGAFLDHYLDVPVDVSKVLFVCTANVTDTIPGPLLDRMEVIRLSGYDLQEKLKIANDYLIPVAMRDMGLWPQETTSVDAKTDAAETDPNTAETGASADASSRAAETDPKAFETADTTSTDASKEGVDGGAEVHATSIESAGATMVTAAGGAPDAKIEQGAVEALIRWYCREAGVRNLQKQVEKICRKLAIKIVERREALEEANAEKDSDNAAVTPSDEAAEADKAAGTQAEEIKDAELVVTEESLSDLVGKPPFTSDRLYEGALPCGTVTGLAWTAMGGSVLYMEATALPRFDGKPSAPSLSVTGQLGDVMKESSKLALLIARRELATHASSSRQAFFAENELHLHCPEGAVPKDGPSAGITITTALLSLGLGVPARADLAMTGEISLNGKVLPIGGLKEKTIAARRAGCTALIFPKANRRDFDELPSYLKDGLEVHFATDYSDVFSVAFPDFKASQAQA